ncbi:phenylalanine--tRNA ligase subunit alpha [Patescibacteria group bacterium]|nr:phenylalanine--tRNA ligase subunit alpha [Patescibacteria group bacterium]MBU1868126.1 phenylalanine--tRNA ligase subunit alpha [Patescibacteria group bacterium]
MPLNKETINVVKSNAFQVLERVDDLLSLSNWEKKYLGKKGEVVNITKQVCELNSVERPIIGTLINDLKQELSIAAQKRKQELATRTPSSHSVPPGTFFDLTAPGKRVPLGHLHPITQMRQYAEDIFIRMGFEVHETREVDDDYHNFESLNMPPQHPARDLWDTFWTENGLVCITHTSNMQIRILTSKSIPIRAIIVGRCFRNEALDARHEHTLHQIEGLYVDKNIKLSDLIGTFKKFLDEFYQRDVKIKTQPSHFPFVEPGIEFLLDCSLCQGTGIINKDRCSTCGGNGWIELAGAGMIHPNVLAEAGLDSQKYSGFAWGFGLDRLVMMKYGIEDIRHFNRGDLRFIQQF